MQDRAFGHDGVIERWLRHFPGAPVDKLADASHYLQEDRPERIADAVKRVVAQTTAP